MGLVLINIMEEIVRRKVESLMPKEDMCQCDECKLDVMVMALNKLPPRYVTSVSGNVFTEFNLANEQVQAELVTTIYQAIARVGKNPRHAKKTDK